jgi:NTE family protein
MYQITQYRDAEDLIKEKRLCDLLIEPEVSQYSAGSFDASDSISRIGIELGKVYYPYFKRLADSLNRISPVKYDPNNRLPRRDSVKIESFDIKGLSKTSRSMLINKLNIRTGKSYTASQLNSSFRSAYSTRYYHKVIYTLEPTSATLAKIKCEVVENPLTALKLGLSFHSFTGASIIANVTQRNLLFDKSRTMLKVSIGENMRTLVQHKQALGKTLRNFVTVGYLFESLPFPIYDKQTLHIQQFLYRFSLNQVDVNYKRLIGENATIGLGVSYLSSYFSPDISATGSFKGNIRNNYAYLNYESNTLNRRFFPTKGSIVNLELGLMFNRRADVEIFNADTSIDISSLVPKKEFQRINFYAAKYARISKRLTSIHSFSFYAQNNYTNFLFDNVFIGGIQLMFNNQAVFAGLKDGQLTSSSFSSIQLGAQYRAINELYVIGRINGGVYGYSTDEKVIDQEKISGILGGSLGLGYNLSPMPMEFTMMYSPQVNKVYGHVRIGFLF